MISKTTSKFRKKFANLPRETQKKSRETYKTFLKNPEHPSLMFKKVHPSLPIYSIRIDLDYRTVGVLSGDTISWFWIGNHDEYSRIIKM